MVFVAFTLALVALGIAISNKQEIDMIKKSKNKE
jgi:hypothetical protein